MMRVIRENWLRILAHVGALAPLAWLACRYWRGLLFEPVRQITTGTGRSALVFLLLSLTCTPIAVLGFKRVMRVRRALGLYAFLYAALHFLTFAGWDYGFDLQLLKPAILDQRFVLAGSVAFLLLLPLAVTSTKSWQKRLGKNWRRLHRLVYLAGISVIVHFVWLSKDPRRTLQYGAVLALLLITRIPIVRKGINSARQRFERNK
ncbi:MAG: sulfoxide reductase heme-binding subunit YedZ [Chloroflexi bacterium]|nr:sulfoxide reductase heme-binding subunit YedZ [Chloroflexota bacterium]